MHPVINLRRHDSKERGRYWCAKLEAYDAQITPDEDTRQECRNVGSWTVSSLSYVH